MRLVRAPAAVEGAPRGYVVVHHPLLSILLQTQRDRSHQATGQAFRDVTGVWLYKAVERQRKAVQAQGQAAEQQGDAVVQQGKAP